HLDAPGQDDEQRVADVAFVDQDGVARECARDAGRRDGVQRVRLQRAHRVGIRHRGSRARRTSGFESYHSRVRRFPDRDGGWRILGAPTRVRATAGYWYLRWSSMILPSLASLPGEWMTTSPRS